MRSIGSKNGYDYFHVLLTVHLSIIISVINQLDAQNFCFTISLFHASTFFEHHVLIIRRSELYYTASGIITPIGGRLVQETANLMHKICFTVSFISCYYMFRAHVLIIRRSKLYYTASGIITPIDGRLTYTHTYIINTYTHKYIHT